MKKLFGLVAVALMLSFATVSVGWAGPAQNHDQQKQQIKERPPKAAKQPASVRHHKGSPGKESVKAPPAHNRDRIKHNKPQGPAKISHAKTGPPQNRDRHQVKRHDPPREHPRNIHRDNPATRSLQRNHSRHRDWPDNGEWRRHFRDWSWFASHRVHNLGTRYADDRHDRALYLHFEPRDNDYYHHLESRYGHSHYRERHHRHGHAGWCHYWFRGDNIVAFFLGDDGYSQTFIWRRGEVEGHALALGILTPDLQILYSSYDADMPPDLAAGYTREVLWATVDDE